MDHQVLSERINTIKERITQAAISCNRDPNEIQLIAVSKTKPIDAIKEVLKTTQRAFGENKIQELSTKMTELPNNEIEWHMIGTLQSNKIKYIAERVDWIHSVPKIKTLLEIDKRAAQHQRIINCLIQVNISSEEQKSGCNPSELKDLLETANQLKHVKICGLMGIATNTENSEQIRAEFASLRELRDQYKAKYEGSIELKHLSMGMTHDLEIAIEEGATMVRVGSAIFGLRNSN